MWGRDDVKHRNHGQCHQLFGGGEHSFGRFAELIASVRGLVVIAAEDCASPRYHNYHVPVVVISAHLPPSPSLSLDNGRQSSLLGRVDKFKVTERTNYLRETAIVTSSRHLQ